MALYDTFLAGCHEKAAEIDDSSGSFGQFELYGGWIKARQAAGADPDETATRLLRWMEADPYGFCSHQENAAKVLNKAGLVAFVKMIRERFDTAATAKPVPGESVRRSPDYARAWDQARSRRSWNAEGAVGRAATRGRIGSRLARATRPRPVGPRGRNMDEPRRTR